MSINVANINIANFASAFLFAIQPLRYPAELKQKGQGVAGRYKKVRIVLDVRTTFVEIVLFDIPMRYARKGKGTEALQWLTGLADLYKVKLVLSVESYGPNQLVDIVLINWYKKAGFVPALNASHFLTRKPQKFSLDKSVSKQKALAQPLRINESLPIPVRK